MDEEDLVVRVHGRAHGHGHDVLQRVESLQVEHRNVPVGHPWEPVAVAVGAPVHANDEVFLVHDTGGPKE